MSVKILRSVGQQILEIRAEELRQKRAARNVDSGTNLPNAVADVSIVFPWEEALRSISPINTIHSHLRAYWYRAGQRWVLYDTLPVELIDDELDTGSMITGKELKDVMAGPRPSERLDWQDLETWPVSDVQHEMFRLWKGFARPFWILQGDLGGHQHKFSPIQSSALLRKGLPPEPPKIGSLPPCPFDNRSIRQLQHLNRLHQLCDSVDALRRSASPEFAAAETDRLEREIRESEMAFIEAQVRPLVEMSTSLVQGSNTRSEYDNEVIRTPKGFAGKAAEAFDHYMETGQWTM